MPCCSNCSRITKISPLARGTTLLTVALLLIYAASYGRTMWRPAPLSPAVPYSGSAKIWVGLNINLDESLVRQFDDGVVVESVILMAKADVDAACRGRQDFRRVLRNGEEVDVTVVSGEVVDFKVKWMPALRRITLGIPLHPDRMSRSDWESLPGIGPRMAERIESDRHKNGDFGRLQGLKRVRGVGEKRISQWKTYF